MLTLTDKEIFIIGDFIRNYLDEKYPCNTDDTVDIKPEDIEIEKVHNKICYYIHTHHLFPSLPAIINELHLTPPPKNK